jgi:hypothetical protein
MTNQEAMKLALEALENSVDLVVEDAYNAEKLYGNYPTRQGKVGGLKVLAENHKEAIKALEEALAKQEQRTLSSRVNDVRVHIEHGKQHDEAMKRVTAKQEQGEPVAWIVHDRVAPDRLTFVEVKQSLQTEVTPLYTTPPQRKPLTDERKKAMKIYTPPFKHFQGYIHDAEGHMVSDDDEVKRTVAHRVRGWGRISYLPNAEAIQDEIGVMMADALNEYYAAHGIKE